jgi:hypothetical protein
MVVKTLTAHHGKARHRPIRLGESPLEEVVDMKRILIALVPIFAIMLLACTGPEGPEGPTGPVGPAGPTGATGDISVASLSCTECHDDTTLIRSKQAQFEESSVHGTGRAFLRGESGSCAGCHGSEGAEARIDAGLPPHDPSVEGIVNVSPYSCRTCHDIHKTYTADDFALTGDGQPVVLEYTGGTFDAGAGNLCANCHQIRNEIPESVDGQIEFTSSRFGTHHGVEASMLLGEGGVLVDGNPSPHYLLVEDACVTCHMGEQRNHTYEPDVDNCTTCHTDIDDFDLNGAQTEIEEMLAEVRPLLIAAGILDEELSGEDGWRAVPGSYPEEVAAAMWNVVFVVEDQSMGVHNPSFSKALLEQAIEALQEYAE